MNYEIEENILLKIKGLYELAFTDLIFTAQTVHRQNHDPRKIRLATLCSIKTGACSEDCAYCSQSIHNKAKIESHPILNKEEVLISAKKAKENLSTHFCMSASWRELPDSSLQYFCDLISSIKALGLEVCATLGLLTQEQAFSLKKAGLSVYNHNIDTGPNFYPQIISSRKFEDRINTIKNIKKANINLCCGGIFGMGESLQDRFEFLAVLADIEPSTVPLNILIPIQGTKLENRERFEVLEFVKMIAITRIILPKAKISIAAGRESMTLEEQALCFLAGGNNIPSGEKLLTTVNKGYDKDKEMIINKLKMEIDI